MKKASTLFRLGIVIEVLCFIGLLLLGISAPEETNEEVLRRMDSGILQFLNTTSESSSDTTNVYISAGIIVFILLLIVAILSIYVGLFLFWNWARFTNLFLYVVNFAISPFLGWTIMPPLDYTLTDFATFLGGIIVASSFLPPIAERFKRQTAEQGAAANP